MDKVTFQNSQLSNKVKVVVYREKPRGKINLTSQVYFKSVSREKHLFRKFGGYGISKAIIDEIKNVVKHVVLLEHFEDGTTKSHCIDIDRYLSPDNVYNHEGTDLQHIVRIE